MYGIFKISSEFENDKIWYQEYNPLNQEKHGEVLDRHGNSLANKFLGLVFAGATEGNQEGGSYWMIKKYPNGEAKVGKVFSFNEYGATPKLFVDGQTIKICTFTTKVDDGPWGVKIRVEQL